MDSMVADNIRAIINKKCFRQGAIAKKAGFREKDFSAMLCGRKCIKACDITPIASALGVDANTLLGFSSEEKAS